MFRANSIEEAIIFYKKLLCFNFANTTMLNDILNVFQFAEITIIENILPIFKSINNSYHVVFQLFMAFVIFAILGMKNTNERIETFKPNKRKVVIIVFFIIASIMSLSQVTTFLYVNF